MQETKAAKVILPALSSERIKDLTQHFIDHPHQILLRSIRAYSFLI